MPVSMPWNSQKRLEGWYIRPSRTHAVSRFIPSRAWSADAKCGRTRVSIATRTARKATIPMAMAAMVRLQDGPERDDQRGGEQGVGDRSDALELEGTGLDAAVEVVQRPAPPGEQQRGARRRHAGTAERDRELGGQPAPPRDALGPGQAVGPALEFEHERRSEDDGDHHRQQREPPGHADDRRETRVERVEELRAAASRRPDAGRRSVGLVRTAHVQPGRYEQRGEDREDDRAENHFGALLAPSDPGHDATSWSGCCR